MSADNRYVLIIAGGAGTRLWPLSRQQKPKQFQKLAGDQTLLQHITGLAKRVVPAHHICVMTAEAFASTVREQLPDVPTDNIITEPDRRDNGPAIVLAMLWMKQRNPDATVALLWADHLIQDVDEFSRTLHAAFAASAEFPDHMVTFGANPTSPETGFGYIEMGRERNRYNDVSVFEVKRFIEKPDLTTATQFMNSWEYLWNIGYEVMRVSEFLQALLHMHPELASVCEKLSKAVQKRDNKSIATAYAELPKLSIEFLFTQQFQKMLVVPADMGWSDLGNWNVLHTIWKQGEETLVTQGPVVPVASSNCLVVAHKKPIALVGVKNLVIVDTGDTILIMHKDAAGHMKELNALLAETNPELL